MTEKEILQQIEMLQNKLAELQAAKQSDQKTTY